MLFLSAIVAGIENNKPVCIGMDCIGCQSRPGTYVAAGTAQENLNGICEALHSEEMDSEQLFTNSMQAFLNAIDRDALSGWGAECYVIGRNECRKRVVQGRND